MNGETVILQNIENLKVVYENILELWIPVSNVSKSG